MRFSKRNVFTIVVCFILLLSIVEYAEASNYTKYFTYKKNDKLYQGSQISKGKKHYTKYTAKRYMTYYQFVKISGSKVYLRPQKGFHESEDPYFSKKIIKKVLSPKCRFYYTNVTFPQKNGYFLYKKVPKKAVIKDMKDSHIYYGSIDDANGKYYTGGYSGNIYMKNGKIVAVLTNGGD